MDLTNPIEFLEDFPIDDTKQLIKTLKTQLGDVTKDPEYDGEADIMLCVLASLERELGKTKNIHDLSKEKQARILADMCLLMQFMQAGEEDLDEEFAYEEFEDEEE